MKRYARGTHPYYQYKRQRPLTLAPVKKHRWPWMILIVPLVGIFLFGAMLYARPLPTLSAQKRDVVRLNDTPQPVIDWPGESQAAFGTVEQGILESEKNQAVRPTASVAKLLTVLTILQAKPLKPNEQGPMIPITQADVDIYNDYYSKDGSSVPVQIGMEISQRQMLQGILLPSANNYADSLAIWAFGSMDNYRGAAQNMAKSLDMRHTTVGSDASGFSPSTTSTADDLTRLGIAAIKHPTVAETVKLSEITLPLAGLKRNTNWLLGDEGVIGIKTGNTNEVGGVFVFAYIHEINKLHKVTMVGVIQGEPTVFDAVLKARGFIKQTKAHFSVKTAVKKGQTLATYRSSWGQSLPVVAKNDISFVSWPGETAQPHMTLDNNVTDLPSGSKVGMVTVADTSSDIVTKGRLEDPTWQWRIFGAR